MDGEFEVYTDSKGEYRFRLKAPNGETILASEGYASKAGCMNGINSVRENCIIPERFEQYEDAGGKHRFRLRAANNQIIGVSEAYESESGMKNGIKSVSKWAQQARARVREFNISI